MTDEQLQWVREKHQAVMERYPEADPDTVLRVLRNLLDPPGVRLRRVLRLGRHSLFRKLDKVSARDD